MSRRAPDCTFAAGSRDQLKCSLATDLLPLPCYPAALSVVTTDTMRLVSSGEESSNDPEGRRSSPPRSSYDKNLIERNFTSLLRGGLGTSTK